jgi:hypothetical protein
MRARRAEETVSLEKREFGQPWKYPEMKAGKDEDEYSPF